MRSHGGRWADYLDAHGVLPTDLSSNTSPLGMSPAARAAAIAALDHADRYPDPQCRELRRALARAYALDESQIVAGNGAGDLIDRLALALRPQRALVTAPTFSEYRIALERGGCRVDEHPLHEKNGFGLDDRILDRIDDGLDVLILCEPNNPTGRTSDPELLARIATRCDQTGTLLVVDECFNDFVDEPEAHSLLGGIESHHLLVLRAFTKFYGMAGLRLGWCACADADLLARMTAVGQPWPVSLVAQEAGVAALADTQYARSVRALVREERTVLASELAKLGCHVVQGEANYLLFFDDTRGLATRLEHEGVLVRDCSNYAGLGPGWYRTAVRTASERAALVTAMRLAHMDQAARFVAPPEPIGPSKRKEEHGA